MATADLIAQQHFVQLGYSLIVVGATLSSACSQSLSDGKRKGKVGLCYLGCPPLPPEFIPENYIFKWNVGLAALYSFIHLYIQQPVMECLAYARHCARLWGYDIELEAGVYKLL